MKILFVLDYVYNGESTNIKLAKKMINFLQAQGHDIVVLFNATDNQKSVLLEYKTILFTTYKDKISYDIIKKCRKLEKPLVMQVIEILKNTKACKNIISTVLFKKSLAENEFKMQIEKACSKNTYDVVVSVSCPHYTTLALAASNINAKKVCYMLDPYWSNKAMAYAVNINREVNLYKRIDCAIITDLMYNENYNSILNKFQHKMKALSFPGIEKKQDHGSNIRFLTQTKINCAFVGNLYPNVRNPKYLLDLLSLLDDSICLCFVGGGREGFEKGFFKKYEDALGKRLIFEDTVQSEVAEDINLRADILVNIGNSIENQLPSKILEYISTGKPILNFYKIDNCPSLKYFEKYPLALNIRENDYTQETINKINKFCLENNKKIISYENIAELFSQYIVENVAKEFENILKQTVGEK